MARKILAVVLTMAVVAGVLVFPAGASADKWAGYMKISTAEELANIQSGNKYYLTNDINLRNWGIWEPISAWIGETTLDGNGFAIRNLTSTTGGLFNVLSDNATIRNLGLINVDVVNSRHVGALANRFDGTVNIENCYVTGKVENTYAGAAAGGFIGSIESHSSGAITFRNCINKANVTSTTKAGGILGDCSRHSTSATFINCVNAGTITGYSRYTGGIVGEFGNGLMESTYNYGTVKSQNSSMVYAVGGLAGSTTGNVIMRDCATTGRTAIGNPAENSTATARTNVPIDDFKKQETYKGFNFDRIWYINPEVNNGFPILRTMMRLYEIPDGTSNNSGGGKAATGVRVIINVKEGDTLQLGAMLNPTDSTDTVTYSSNKTSVASVNNSGLVTARAKGTADITVTAGRVRQTVRIRVT